MGADIHMVLERKDKTRGKWVGINNFNSRQAHVHVRDKEGQYVAAEALVMWEARSRNYAMFAALAGVRGDGPDPRGVPDDASDLALLEIDGWGADGHSHSWLPMSEALPIFMKHQFNGDGAIIKARIGGKSLTELHMRVLSNEFAVDFEPDREELDDYRLVFWFDN